LINADHDFRSIYLPFTRNVEPEMMAIFDGADSSAVQGARQTTNVPSQILFLLNSDFVEEKSRRIARKFVSPAEEPRRRTRSARQPPQVNLKQFDDQYDELSWLLFSRPATTKEKSAAKSLLLKHRDDPMQGWVSITRSLLASAEFRSID
jgi:hypothetical protein